MNKIKQVLQPQPKIVGFNPGYLAAGIVLIMIFIMGLLKIYSPDLGFHLKSAEWILHNKQFIYTDPFSYGSAEHKYFDLQWLYQLLVYGLYKKGEWILIIANALFITISFILVWFRFLKNADVDNSNIKLGFFALMMLVFVQPLSFEIRPQVLSWIFLNLILFFLELYKKGNKKALYLLPVIMLFWANMHSIAILGLVTIGIYNVGSYLETNKIDKKLLLYAVFSFVVFFITPYFFEGFLYSLSQFGIISGNSLFKSYLGELQSPFTAKEIAILGSGYFKNPLLIIHLSALLSIFSIYRSLIQKKFTDTILLIAFLVLLYLAHRNYGIFILVSLPLFVKYLLNWLELRKNRAFNPKKLPGNKKEQQLIITEVTPGQKFYRRVSFAAIIIAIFISITSITDGYRLFIHSPNRVGLTVDKDQLPVEATSFLNENHIKGKLLNHLDFGGYLMAHYQEKVFIDGRMDLFEEDFFRKYYESLTVPGEIRKLLNEYGPDIVIFPYVKASNWWNYFVTNKKQSGYKAVYFDGLSVIYLKNSGYPQLAELTEKDVLKDIDPTAVGRINKCIETSRPNALMALINAVRQKQSFSIADQNKATYCFTNGFDTAGLCYSINGIEKSTIQTPNIFKNLSIFFQDKKMYNEAQLCEDKSE